MAQTKKRSARRKKPAQAAQKRSWLPILVLVGAALLAGYAMRGPSGQAQPIAQSVQAKKKPAWSVYEGATRCEMIDSDRVACDNGYRGPLR